MPYPTLEEQLGPIVRRQQWQRAVRYAAMGLLIASTVAAVWSIARLAGAGGVTPLRVVLVSIAGAIAGAIIGRMIPGDLRFAAATADRMFGLKDRTVSALSFVRGGDASTLHQLQLADAQRRLAAYDGRTIVPLSAPKLLRYGPIVCLAAIALSLWPLAPEPAAANAPSPLAIVLSESEHIISRFENLEERAEELETEEVTGLVAELKGLAEEMQKPDVDRRDALAKLSEMQAAIAAQQAEFNLELVDAKLEELAEALGNVPELEPTARAIDNGDYRKAAEQLEGMEPLELDDRESEALNEDLQEAEQSAEEAGLEELAEATEELRGAMTDDEGSEAEQQQRQQEAAEGMSDVLEKQAGRKEMAQALASELAALAEAKGRLQGEGEGEGQGEGNGEGDEKGESNDRSDRPSDQWGTGTNQETGENTSLDSTRERLEVTGIAGEGPSEVEKVLSTESDEEAEREYRERFEEYRKLSEAVLDAEPLPLGHRQTIRRYFELIRPRDGEDGESE